MHQADQISLGGNGRTSYRLPAPLGAGYTYYWRTRAADGANTGPYSSVSNFNVVPPVVIDAPVAIAPSGKITTNKPEFKVTNGAISGTTGVVYRFEVSHAGDFSTMVAVVTACPNGSGSTTMTLGELPYKTTYYWRVRGSDGTKESPYSNTQSFTTPMRRRRAAAGGGGGVPGRRAEGPWRSRAGQAARCRVMARASCARWRAPIRVRCRTRVRTHGGSWQFMDQVVDTLRTYDTRWGYNGKRGNANDPSKDVVAYHYGPGPDARLDRCLHHRHHRRALRSDAVADLERRDATITLTSGTIGQLDQPRTILGCVSAGCEVPQVLRTSGDGREVLV